MTYDGVYRQDPKTTSIRRDYYALLHDGRVALIADVAGESYLVQVDGRVYHATREDFLAVGPDRGMLESAATNWR